MTHGKLRFPIEEEATRPMDSVASALAFVSKYRIAKQHCRCAVNSEYVGSESQVKIAL